MTFPFWSSVDCKEKGLKIENRDRDETAISGRKVSTVKWEKTSR
jgi:hypothetical protein